MQTKNKGEESHASSKKRDVAERSVVAVKVKVVTSNKKQKSEGATPPTDSWSWRKYGQKPIKGSPYPRGYYKCSTSKGCTAKKQVERSKTDASTLIITYTSTHNHPGPDLSVITNTTEENPKTPNQEEEPKKEQKTLVLKTSDEAHLHYSQSPFHDSQDIITNQDDIINCYKENLNLLPSAVFDDDQETRIDQVMKLSKCKSDENENDFFDELDELPSTSSFTELLRSNFIDQGRFLVKPSF